MLASFLFVQKKSPESESQYLIIRWIKLETNFFQIKTQISAEQKKDETEVWSNLFSL